MNYLLIIGIAVFVFLIFRFMTKADMELRFVDGKLESASGDYPFQFVTEVEEILKMAEINEAVIKGNQSDGTMNLKFSKEIPENYQQRIINIWSFYQ